MGCNLEMSDTATIQAALTAAERNYRSKMTATVAEQRSYNKRVERLQRDLRRARLADSGQETSNNVGTYAGTDKG